MIQDVGFLLKPPEAWREYDAKLTCITAKHGPIELTAFGLHGRSTRRAALIQPFHLLRFDWEMKKPPYHYLSDVKLERPFTYQNTMANACGWYLNELTLYCLAGIETEACADLIRFMEHAFAKLEAPFDQSQAHLEACLRQYEAQLLSLQGYALYASFTNPANHNENQRYRYSFSENWQAEHQGLTAAQINQLNACTNWQVLADNTTLLNQLKHLHRQLFSQLLGNRHFKSRAYFTPPSPSLNAS